MSRSEDEGEVPFTTSQNWPWSDAKSPIFSGDLVRYCISLSNFSKKTNKNYLGKHYCHLLLGKHPFRKKVRTLLYCSIKRIVRSTTYRLELVCFQKCLFLMEKPSWGRSTGNPVHFLYLIYYSPPFSHLNIQYYSEYTVVIFNTTSYALVRRTVKRT
jgi:hypothetical protein